MVFCVVSGRHTCLKKKSALKAKIQMQKFETKLTPFLQLPKQNSHQLPAFRSPRAALGSLCLREIAQSEARPGVITFVKPNFIPRQMVWFYLNSAKWLCNLYTKLGDSTPTLQDDLIWVRICTPVWIGEPRNSWFGCLQEATNSIGFALRAIGYCGRVGTPQLQISHGFHLP